jgi:hypothetical protein
MNAGKISRHFLFGFCNKSCGLCVTLTMEVIKRYLISKFYNNNGRKTQIRNCIIYAFESIL